MIYNLHTHTKRCHHAAGDDREYVESAIKAGIKVLGFADHCPQFFPNTDYYSHFRMRPEDAEGYVKSVRSLADEYKNDIKILLGFETEYYPKTFNKFMDFIKGLELDYLIMGQHFVGNEFEENSYYTAFQRDENAFLEAYVNQVIEGLETGIFTYVAHPDIVNYQGSNTFYKKQMTKLCTKVKKLKIPLEFNMLGYINGKCYPNPLFWDIAGEIGNKALIGFDAHSPDSLEKIDFYKRCVQELNVYRLKPLPFNELNIIKPTI
jgi:histidinol-phosphatase (PHP family)